jgi:hypothetical protein
MFANNYGGEKKGPEWDHVIIVEQKKEKPQGAVQVLRPRVCLITKETSWPGTDYKSQITCVSSSLNMLLLLQGKSGTDQGGAV